MTIEYDPAEAVVHWRERYELERKRSIQRLQRIEELEWLIAQHTCDELDCGDSALERRRRPRLTVSAAVYRGPHG